MKLREQINRIQSMMGVINEGLHDTSWEDEKGNKVTLIELIKVTEDIPVQNIPVKDLESKITNSDWDEDDYRKVETANLKYPIMVFVNDNGKILTIIDGNHRTQKAVNKGLKTIKGKLIPINGLPKHMKKVFNHIR